MRRALVAMLLPAMAAAQPTVVAYQGFLTDDNGVPVDNVVDLHFKLYSAPTGGTEIASQTESNVNVQLGTFAVGLDIDEADLAAASELYLEVAVGTPGNVLLPRQRLGSVPFALRCGDVDALGGVDASAYQVSVTGSCAAGSAIQAVNADGTVLCDFDDGEGGGVTSVTDGAGLLNVGTPADVVLSLNTGAGLLVDTGNLLAADFGGSGSATTAAREDHAHAYLPPDSLGGCFPDRLAGIDPATGSPICAPDQSTTYGNGMSGNITYDGFGTFDLNSFVTLPGSITVTSGDEFIYSFSHTSSRSLHASDFHPTDAGFQFWYADYQRGYLNAPGATYLYAPLHLPNGAFVNEVRITYDQSNDEIDSLYCALGILDLASGSYNWGGGSATPECPFFCGPQAQASTFPGVVVDNLNYAYIADCYMYNAGTNTVSLSGYQVFYEYPDLQGPP